MTDVYRIGVSIALANGVSPVLGIIGRDLLGLNTKIGAAEAGFSRLRLAIGGAVAMLGGAALLGGMGELVKKGAELTHLQQRMAAAGMTQVEQARAISKSWELTAKYRSVGVRTIGETILETMPAYGSAKEATALAGIATRAMVVLNGILPNNGGGDAVEQMFSGVKAAELRNIALNPAAVETFFNDMVRVAAVSAGKVMPKDFFQFVKYSRTNAPYLSEQFLAGVAPTLIQELGPSGAGNAVTTLGQTVIGGRMTKRAAAAMEDLGLLDPKNVLKGMGMGVAIKKGGIEGWQTAAKDPYEWAQTTLLPALVAHGYKTPIDQRLEFGKLFGQRMAETMANILVTQAPRIEKDRALYARSPGLAMADELQANDFQTNVKSMKEQWNNMLMALGKPLVGPAVNALKSLTGLFTEIGQFATAHPDATKLIAEGVVALGAALVVGGAVAIGAAAIMAVAGTGEAAIVAAGIAALVGALGTLVAFNWPKLKKVGADIAGWLPHVGEAPPRGPPGHAPGHPAGRPAPHAQASAEAASVTAARARDAAALRNQAAQFRWFADSAIADARAIGSVGVEVWANMANQLQPLWNWIAGGFNNWIAQIKSDWATLGNVANWLGFTKPGKGPPTQPPPGPWTAPTHPLITTEQFKGGLRVAAQQAGFLPWDPASLKLLTGAAADSKKALTDLHRPLVDVTKSTGALQTAQLGFVGLINSAAAGLKAAIAGMAPGGQAAVVPPRNGHQMIQVHSHTHLDGREIATTVSNHQARALSGPNAMSSRNDHSAVLAGVGVPYTR